MSDSPFEDVVSFKKEEVWHEEAYHPSVPFPIHALNPLMRDIVKETARVHQIPIELPAMAAIATVSGALGKAFILTDAVNGKESYGNLYTVIAAPKSTGKGAASIITKPLLAASEKMAMDFQEIERGELIAEEKILKKKEEAILKQFGTKKREKGKPLTEADEQELRGHLIQIQQRLEVIKPQIASLPTYWVQNATSEAMAAQFVRNNDSLFCFSPEAGEVVRVMFGKYQINRKGDFDLYLSGYSVEPWRTDRVQRGVVQISPCLSALLFCQPSILRELLSNEEAFERGLTARMLFCLVEPEIQEDDGIIRTICPNAQRNWAGIIGVILHARTTKKNSPHRIVCSEGARKVFRDFHNESVQLRNGSYRDIEGELGRWRENAIRIAIGQCVADSTQAEILTEEQAQRAVEITRWCVYSGLNLFKAGRMEKLSKRVAKLQEIIRGNEGRLTLRDLGLRHSFKPEEVEHLISQFPDKLCMIEHKPHTGRPTKVLSIPEIGKAVS